MESIVTLSGGMPVVSSTAIAEGVGREHKSVIQLVRQNLSDFEEFGPCAFEMRMVNRPQGGGHPQEIALLNEQQATLLLTYMRNNEVVRAFKKRLVRAFYEMAQRVRKGGDDLAPTPVETPEARARRLKRERDRRHRERKRAARLAARADVSAPQPGPADACDARSLQILTNAAYRREASEAVVDLFRLLPPGTPTPELDVKKIADGLILQALSFCEFRVIVGNNGESYVRFVPREEIRAQRFAVDPTDEHTLLALVRSAGTYDGRMPLDILKKVVQEGIKRLALVGI